MRLTTLRIPKFTSHSVPQVGPYALLSARSKLRRCQEHLQVIIKTSQSGNRAKDPRQPWPLARPNRTNARQNMPSQPPGRVGDVSLDRSWEGRLQRGGGVKHSCETRNVFDRSGVAGGSQGANVRVCLAEQGSLTGSPAKGRRQRREIGTPGDWWPLGPIQAISSLLLRGH